MKYVEEDVVREYVDCHMDVVRECTDCHMPYAYAFVNGQCGDTTAA